MICKLISMLNLFLFESPRLNKNIIASPIGAIIYGYLTDCHRYLSVSDMFYRDDQMSFNEKNSVKTDADGGVCIRRPNQSSTYPLAITLFFDRIPLWTDLLPGRYSLTCQMRLRRHVRRFFIVNLQER